MLYCRGAEAQILSFSAAAAPAAAAHGQGAVHGEAATH